MKRAIHVQFVHGLEGSPGGRKARALADAFSTTCVAMGSPPPSLPGLRDHFEVSLTRQVEELARRRPNVLVGSSFGGAIAAAMLARGHYGGPTLLICPAVQHFVPDVDFAGERVIIAHGRNDALIPFVESEALATRTGARLYACDDGHSMKTFSETMLVEMVGALAAP